MKKNILILISILVLSFLIMGCTQISDQPSDDEKEATRGVSNLGGQGAATGEKPCPVGWVGDNWCDDGSPASYDPSTNCNTQKYNFDGGDCDAQKQSGPYCTDSDGNDIMKKGVVESHYASGDVAAAYLDSCADANTVEEVTCYGTQPVATNYDCENGCNDGACLEKPTSSPGDLSLYPNMFLKDGKLDVSIVGSDNLAKVTSSDAGVYISLYNSGPYKDLYHNKIEDPQKEDGYFNEKDYLDAGIFNYNLIVLGNSCLNSLTASIEGKSSEYQNNGDPKKCKDSDLSPGESLIKIVKWSNGNNLIVIKGYSYLEHVISAGVLATRSDELSGSEVKISGTDVETATITKIN